MLDAVAPGLAADEFLEPGEARRRLLQVCAGHPELAEHVRLGESEDGRPIDGFVLGRGELNVSLIAGNHADEPVGPDFLRRFLPAVLDRLDRTRPVLDRVRFCIVPHTNPDGECANAAWRTRWPCFEAYLEHAVREQPGRDLEFGFPELRQENAVVARWLRSEGPFQLHGSLHGMGLAEGALLLIDRRWGYRTGLLQVRFRAAVREERLSFHDHNRQGEKGFFYLGPGFWTTPEGSAMRSFFLARGDAETAARFHDSSMEFVRSLGGDPLCYVTELPLFLVDEAPDAPVGVPLRYLALKAALPAMRLRLGRGRPIDEDVRRYGLRPVPLRAALRVQLRTLSGALAQVGGSREAALDPDSPM